MVGTDDLKSGGKYYAVGRLFKHDDYDKDLHRNDLTVIRMQEKFEFSDQVAAIELSSEEAPNGAHLEFFGFGVNSVTVILNFCYFKRRHHLETNANQ